MLPDLEVKHGIVFHDSSSRDDVLVYGNTFTGTFGNALYPIRISPSEGRTVYLHKNPNALIDPPDGFHGCPAGYYANTDMLSYLPKNVASLWCARCPSGHFSDGVNGCTQCPAGRYSNGGSNGPLGCSSCPLGNYVLRAVLRLRTAPRVTIAQVHLCSSNAQKASFALIILMYTRIVLRGIIALLQMLMQSSVPQEIFVLQEMTSRWSAERDPRPQQTTPDAFHVRRGAIAPIFLCELSFRK